MIGAASAASGRRTASIAARSARSTSVTPRPVAPESRCTGRPLAARRVGRGRVGGLGGQRVDLVEAEDARLVGEAGAVGLELAEDDAVVVGHGLGGAVDQVQEDGAALDVGEEGVAEAPALVGALDQAGDVGHDELGAVDADDAEAGVQRGEGVVGDLGPGVGGGAEEGRLAGVRQADEAGVGDQLQPQPERALDALLAGIGVARRLVGRGLEAQVAPAAVAALGEQHPLAGAGQVGDQRLAVLVEDLGADRHLEHDVVGALAGALRAAAGLAVLGEEMLLVAIVDQGVEALDRLGDHVAAAAAVAAARAAELDELLAAEGDAAVAAGTGADLDAGVVEELHRRRSGEHRGDSGRSAPSRRAPANGPRRPAIVGEAGTRSPPGSRPHCPGRPARSARGSLLARPAHHCLDRLAGVAGAPEGGRDPVADLGLAGPGGLSMIAPTRPFSASSPVSIAQPISVAPGGSDALDEALGEARRIGVRDHARSSGHPGVAGVERDQRGVGRGAAGAAAAAR